MHNIVAIIPARGGSKGIPHKNLIDFCGQPLISWSIQQALAAKSISSVWVTSDSEQILDVAVKQGAKPIIRPAELAGDTANSESAWLHALQEIERQGEKVDLVVGMQATSPLREASDLEKGIRDFFSQECDSLFSCAALEDFFIWSKNSQGQFTSLNYDHLNRKRRQDVGRQWVENGSFYIFKPWVLKELGNRLGGRIGISEMAFWKTFEIDSLQSLDMCDTLMRYYLLDKSPSQISTEERQMENEHI